jgi:nucleotide-binding universal stress UspA family protein
MNSGFKSILVPLYGQGSDFNAVDFASVLTWEMQAEATVLYLSRILNLLPEDQRKRYLSMVENGDFNKAMAFLEDFYQAELQKAADEAHLRVADKFKLKNVPERSPQKQVLVDTAGFCWEQNIVLQAEVNRLLFNKVLVSDVVVTSAFEIEGSWQRDILMLVVRDSGKPLIVVPTERVSYQQMPRKILIAWKQTAHTVRAISAAMPLLRSANSILVLEIAEREELEGERVSASDVSRWLSRHGIVSQAVSRNSLGGKAESILDEEISHFATDALVMGCYSRSRMSEMVFGGFTQHVLNGIRVPTLLAH